VPFGAWADHEESARACDLIALGGGRYRSGPTHPQPGLLVTFGAREDRSRQEDGGYTASSFTVEAIDRDALVSVTMRRETGATARSKRQGAREIETGDAAFDRAFFVTGSGTSVRAVLDVETRRLLLNLRRGADLEIVKGQLRAHVRSYGADLALRGAVRLALAAADRLRRPSDVPGALARNAREDPEPGVRMENLVALLRDHPDHELTRTALRSACDDPSDDVRVRAATALGDAGRATLLDLARQPYVADLPASRAVAALGDHLPTADAQAALHHALLTRRLLTARACLERLARFLEAP